MQFALLSSGDWVSYISNNTTDSEKFWNFILIVHKFIELWTHIRVTQTRILLDSASIHNSFIQIYIIFCQKVRIENDVPLQYSPQLAPVEIVFGMLMRKPSMKRKQKAIRFGSIDGRKEILFTLRGFWLIKVQRLWSIFIREAKKWILSWRRDEIINSRVCAIIKEVIEDRKV